MRDADAGDVSSSVVARFGNDVPAVAAAAFTVVEPYDIGKLDDRGRVLHTCGVDELDTVGGGNVPVKPRGPAASWTAALSSGMPSGLRPFWTILSITRSA